MTGTKALIAAALGAVLAFSSGHAGPAKWVSAYYGGWWQGSQLNPGEIDYSTVTHIIHFALIVGSDGTVAGAGNGITPESAASAVRAAHAGGKKILISVGGSNSDGAYGGATTAANREKFVSTLLQFMNMYGYAGIDIDWEPLQTTSHYNEFIGELREKMTAARPGSLLFTAVMTGTDTDILLRAAKYFDQINIMTYDMSGPWSRWETWHNAPLYNGGAKFQSTGKPLPSTDGVVRALIDAGIPAARLGIGIDFYGYRWWGGEGTTTGGVTKPRQAWASPPNVKDNIPYFTLMETYSRFPVSWDSGAAAAYIGIDNAGSALDEFVSFDEERSIRAKAEYVNRMGLGGVIVYDLGGGYRRGLAAGYRDILMQNVRYAFLGGKAPMKDDVPPTVRILAPREGSSISGPETFLAEVTDNSAVASVEFNVDGARAAPVVTRSPYSAPFNTWKYSNGSHIVEVVAFDAFGNRASSAHRITVANRGTAPVPPDRVVYDGALHSPFANTSWGAFVDLASTAVVRSGPRSAEVSYMAWGAFDLLSGSWGAESPVDPSEYDTLRADVYPLAPVKLKIAYYSGPGTEVSLKEKEWNSIAVPVNASQPFSRFYFQSTLNRPVKCYFENIRFTAKTYAATAAR